MTLETFTIAAVASLCSGAASSPPVTQFHFESRMPYIKHFLPAGSIRSVP
jgi:hypothetical protein